MIKCQALLWTITSFLFIGCKTSATSELMKSSSGKNAEASAVSAEDKLLHQEVLFAQGLFRYSTKCRVQISASDVEVNESTTYSVVFSGKESCVNSQYPKLSKLYSCRPRGFGNGDEVKCVGLKDQDGNKVEIQSERGLGNSHLDIEAPSTIRFSIHRIEGEANSTEAEQSLFSALRFRQGAYQFSQNGIQCDFTFGVNNENAAVSTSFTATFSGKDAKCKKLSYKPLAKPRDCSQSSREVVQPNCIELTQSDNKEKVKLLFLISKSSSLTFLVDSASFQLLRK